MAGADVAVVHFQLPLEKFGVGLVTDGDEYARYGQFAQSVGFVAQAQAGHPGGIAQYFVQRAIERQFNASVGDFLHQFVDHDFFGAELVAAVNQGDFRANVRQIQRLFQRRIAAADHCHFLAAIEKTVAGGAGGNAPPLKGGLRRQTQIFCRSAGGDNQRIAGIDAAVAAETEGAHVQFGGVDVVVDQLRVKAFGMALQARHQIWPLHAVGVPRPVIDFGGSHQLPALRHAGNQHRREIGARGIDGGGIPGRAGAKNQQTGVLDGQGRSHDGASLRRSTAKRRLSRKCAREG